MGLVTVTPILGRFFDVRAGERSQTARAFVLVMLIVAGHTILETARDALFLSTLPASRLNLVYIALAVLTFFAAAASTWVASRLGRRRALVGSLAVIACATLALRTVAPTPAFAIGFYIYSGLIGAVVIPQFWMLAGHVFTVSQGRRLFALLAAGSVVGGVAGASTAAISIGIGGVRSLFGVSSGLFFGAIFVAMFVGERTNASSPRAEPVRMPREAFRNNALLGRIAILVGLATSAVLVVDYLFKSAAAHSMPAAQLGQFFARFYAITNAVSLVVQLLVASRVLRRLGVVGANAYTPLLLTLSSLGVLTTGVFGAVVLVKGIDGGLRYSLNKVATELLYLPIPLEARERGKSFIDGVLTRVAQAATAVGLYVLATRGFASTRILAAIVIVLTISWVLSVVAVRAKYLALFRSALAGGRIAVESQDLDLASAETLVEGLASRNPETVAAAMSLLAQKNHGRLIPALVLYHESPLVLAKALELFSATDRTDWIPLAERLLESPNESVRVSAIRALARRGVVGALELATGDHSTRMQAYASFQLILRDGTGDLIEEPLVASSLAARSSTDSKTDPATGDYARAVRTELLAAIADTPTPRAATTLLALAEDEEVMQTHDGPIMLARAMSEIRDPRFIPALINRLTSYTGRDAAREALVQIGDEAFDALVVALRDRSTDEHLRLHIPRPLGAFGTQHACDVLTEQLKIEHVGIVRYKVLRGLNMLVGADVVFDTATFEVECRKNLVEHLRLLASRVALSGARASAKNLTPDTKYDLLTSLLDDKVGQALERAFRLLKLMYIEEDIHRVYVVARTGTRVARTNALEYLDALLIGPGREPTRDLLRIVLDDVDDVERIKRAAPSIGRVPLTAEDTIFALIDDDDDLVAMLAARYASTLRNASLTAAATRALERPSIAGLGAEWFGSPPGAHQ